MKILLGLCALVFSFAVAWQAAADQYVHGYTRSNGTYVQPYHRSYGNGTVQDNYSYRGNANPSTGSTGSNYWLAKAGDQQPIAGPLYSDGAAEV
jgi:hypothetical protein